MRHTAYEWIAGRTSEMLTSFNPSIDENTSYIGQRASMLLRDSWELVRTWRGRLQNRGLVREALALYSLSFRMFEMARTSELSGLENDIESCKGLLQSHILGASEKSYIHIWEFVVKPESHKNLKEQIGNLQGGGQDRVISAYLDLELAISDMEPREFQVSDFFGLTRLLGKGPSMLKILFGKVYRREISAEESTVLFYTNLESLRRVLNQALAIYKAKGFWGGAYSICMTSALFSSEDGDLNRSVSFYSQATNIATDHGMGDTFILMAKVAMDACISNSASAVQRPAWGHAIAWYEGFLESHPTYTIDVHLSDIFTNLLVGSIELGNPKQAGKNMLRLVRLDPVVDNIWGSVSSDDLEAYWTRRMASVCGVPYEKDPYLSNVWDQLCLELATQDNYEYLDDLKVGITGFNLDNLSFCRINELVPASGDFMKEILSGDEWLPIITQYGRFANAWAKLFSMLGGEHQGSDKVDLIQELAAFTENVENSSSSAYESAPRTLAHFHVVLAALSLDLSMSGIQGHPYDEDFARHHLSLASGSVRDLRTQSFHEALQAVYTCEQLESNVENLPAYQPSSMIVDIMNHLNTSCQIIDDIRQELSALPKKDEAWVMKRDYLSSSPLRLCLNIAVDVLVESKSYGTAWNWVQRGKARSMTDFMAPFVVVPEHWKRELYDDAQLLEEEQGLVKRLATADANARHDIQRKHHVVLQSMLSKPSFQRILSLRGYTYPKQLDFADAIQSAQWRSPEVRPEVVFIDYFLRWDESVMMFVNRGKKCHCFEVGTYSEVERWVEDNLAHEDERSGPLHKLVKDDQSDAAREWHQMDILVEPLEKLTQPGDLLVICPTDTLYRLPFHALFLDGAFLIERNPVVYTQSASVLETCINQRNQTSDIGQGNIVILGNLTKDYPSAGISCRKLSERFDTEACFTDEELSPRNFSEKVTDARLLHYHGHALYAGGGLKDLGLRINNKGEVLDLQHILSLPLQRGAHVSLIACASSKQDTGMANEPIGIIPAFMFAGASSVLATLWPIQNSVGESFCKDLYSAFDQPPQGCPSAWIDLAKVVQDAVLKLKDLKKAPYFWAPFVLYGCWVYGSGSHGMLLNLIEELD